MLVIAAVLLGMPAHADNPDHFDLSAHGSIMPIGEDGLAIRVTQRDVPFSEHRMEDVECEAVELRIGNHDPITLGRLIHYFNGAKKVAADGVRARSVQFASLKDRPDLLLVAWSNYGDPGGTGNYTSRGCMIVSLAGDKPTVMLRSNDLASGASRHVGIGIKRRSFAYDPDQQRLIERLHVRGEETRNYRTPLAARIDDEEQGVIWVTSVNYVAERSIRIDGEDLKPSEWIVRYDASAGDRADQIAAFFLGRFGSAQAILDANRKEQFNSWEVVADTWITIPLPSAWVDTHHGSTLTPDSKKPEAP